MSLTKLLRGATMGLALLACDASPEPVQGCQYDNQCKEGRYCVNGQCQGNGNSTDPIDNDICSLLCDKVWNDCNGLPGANYWLGNSYSDCLNGCPDFLEGVAQSPYADKMNKSLDCVANGGRSCESLQKDSCEMDEGDLFQKYSPDRDWCTLEAMRGKESRKQWCESNN